MSERPALDLSDILKQYEVFGGSNRGGLSQDQIEFQRLEQERIQRERENNPMKQGHGPLLVSTCTALVPSPMWCWDVLGYYRTLGVHWKATRKQLMTAYQDLDGPNSVGLTHVFKQLLNPSIRRAYDMTPLGHLFMDDIYVQQALKAAAVAEARRRSQETGREVTPEEVIAEEYSFTPDEDEDALDKNAKNDEPLVLPDSAPWPYSYFTWRSKKSETDVLAEWQALVIREVSKQGAVLTFAVGFVGKQPHRYLVGRIENLQVVFLNDKECPTEALASAAALALLNDLH